MGDDVGINEVNYTATMIFLQLSALMKHKSGTNTENYTAIMIYLQLSGLMEHGCGINTVSDIVTMFSAETEQNSVISLQSSAPTGRGIGINMTNCTATMIFLQ